MGGLGMDQDVHVGYVSATSMDMAMNSAQDWLGHYYRLNKYGRWEIDYRSVHIKFILPKNHPSACLSKYRYQFFNMALCATLSCKNG